MEQSQTPLLDMWDPQSATMLWLAVYHNNSLHGIEQAIWAEVQALRARLSRKGRAGAKKSGKYATVAERNHARYLRKKERERQKKLLAQ